MKPSIILIVALVAVLAQGCIIKSLHPFYTEQDVMFKSELLATWIDQDSGNWIIQPVTEKPNAYQMKYNKDGKEAVFMVHLFRLKGDLYLDFLPLSSNAQSIDLFDLHLMPTHSVAKVSKLSKEEIVIKWFNEEWLRELFAHNRIKISHEAILDELPKEDDDKTYVLTASTDELQKFLIKYGNEDAAFAGDNTMWLRLTKAI